MGTMASQITSITVVNQAFIRTQIKENIKAPRHWPLCGEVTGTGEFPAQMARNAENVSIWWRHHVPACPDSYAPYGLHCYRPYILETEYFDAKRRCHRDGLSWTGNGTLAKVDSLDKNFFIGQLFAYR